MERVSVTRTCKECGEDFTYETSRIGNRRSYCDECRRKRDRESQASKKRQETSSKKQVDVTCAHCGEQFTYVAPANGHRRKYCDACKVIKSRERVARHRAKRIAEGTSVNVPRGTLIDVQCERCGETFSYPSGTVRRRLCDPCREIQRKEVARKNQRDARERYRKWREENPVTRYCEICGDELPRGATPHSRRRYCEPCGKRQKKERDMIKRELYSLRRVGIMSLEERDEILRKQGGGCAICGRPEPDASTRGSWAKDHWHGCPNCEKGCPECFRGLLCGPCNIAIGLMGDDPDRLKLAIKYLKKQGHKVGY